ncbi:MAG: exodeoxyribonuclease V subunit gamma [Abditibacteriota bacterium]|nr:exodeoxyribonuclease V subunit gamma [Abditibacteriota bacterium]
MSIKAYKSLSINTLIKQLAEDIKKNSKAGSLFDVPTHRIILPTLVNQNFIKFELEKHLKALVKVEFDTLKWCPYRLAKKLKIKHLDQTLTQKDLFFQILCILNNIKEPEFTCQELKDMEPVLEYLGETEDKKEPENVRRQKKIDFAEKLSNLFITYIEENDDDDPEYDIIKKWNSWIKEKVVFTDKQTPIEKYEYLIYKKLVDNIRKNNTELTKLTILKEFDFSSADYIPDEKLYIFNFPYIPKGTLNTLKRMSEFLDINIYVNTLNEDLPVVKPKNSIQKKYLKNIETVFESVEDIDIDDIEKTELNNTVLDFLKYNVTPTKQDTTLQILACPGIYREAECVYESIIHNLQTDPSLNLEDIGVVLCDHNSYYPAIKGIFSRNSEKIPFNFTCATPNVVNSYIEGIQNLCELYDKNFTYAAVKEFLNNPCVRKKLNITEKDVSDFLDFAEKQKILAFFNIDQKNNYFNSDLSNYYTWSRTQTNLLFGSIMDIENNWSIDSEGDEEITPQTEIGDYSKIFNTLMKIYFEYKYYDDYYNDLSKSSDPKDAKAEDAVRKFKEFIDEFLAPETPNDSVKILVDNTIDDYLHQVVSRNFYPSIRDIFAYISMKASSSNYSKGQPFTKGVVVGRFMNMRVCNFKILYIMGLNQGTFPREDDKSSLDLTKDSPQRNKLVDEDKYALYKLICSTQDKVYLTYSNKDLEKDAELYLSGAVGELKNYISNKITKEFEEINMPLFSRSLKYYDKEKPSVEITDAWVIYDKEAFNLAQKDYCNKYKAPLPEYPNQEIYEALSPYDEEIHITVKQLSKFLINPAEYALDIMGKKDRYEDSNTFLYEPVNVQGGLDKSILIKSLVSSGIKKEKIEDVLTKSVKDGIIPNNPIGKKLEKYYADIAKDVKAEISDKIKPNILLGDIVPPNTKITEPKIPIDPFCVNVNIKVDSNIFPYGIRKVYLSGLIDFVDEENKKLYLITGSKEKDMCEYEAKLLLMLYSLAKGVCDFEILYYYYKDKDKIIQSASYRLIDTDAIQKDLILDKIKENITNLCMQIQNKELVYDFSPYNIYKEVEKQGCDEIINQKKEEKIEEFKKKYCILVQRKEGQNEKDYCYACVEEANKTINKEADTKINEIITGFIENIKKDFGCDVEIKVALNAEDSLKDKLKKANDEIGNKDIEKKIDKTKKSDFKLLVKKTKEEINNIELKKDCLHNEIKKIKDDIEPDFIKKADFYYNHDYFDLVYKNKCIENDKNDFSERYHYLIEMYSNKFKLKYDDKNPHSIRDRIQDRINCVDELVKKKTKSR